jgi:hypothetical protein
MLLSAYDQSVARGGGVHRKLDLAYTGGSSRTGGAVRALPHSHGLGSLGAFVATVEVGKGQCPVAAAAETLDTSREGGGWVGDAGVLWVA